MTALNPFETFWSLGFRRLVPVIPPDAEVSPKSSLAKRRDARGKAVGIKGRDGLWRGMDWIGYEADEADTRRWSAMGAGVGIKTGRGIVAIDADTLSKTHAATIKAITEAHFGELAIRIGRYPKALYVLRVSEDVPYMRVEFGGDGGDAPERVEILSDGRQFVAHGVHPVTREMYYWPRDLPRFDDIPVASRADLEAFLEALRQALPAARPVHRERDASSAPVNQESLRGDPDLVRRAVAAIPNAGEDFEGREAYLQLGYAIRAAIPDDELAAFEVFSDFCERWRDGENDPDVVAADWRRMKPPYKVGAGYIYDLADRITGSNFSAMPFFDDLELNPLQPNPFEVLAEREAKQRDADTYPLLRVSDIMARPPPKFLLDRHVPETSVGFLYSEPGVGKSFLALDMALHIAAGRNDWHGDAIAAPDNAAVLYIASEGSYGFRNRIRAWSAHRQTAPAALDTFFMIERSINFMVPEDVDRLLRTVRAAASEHSVSFSLVVVDTVSRAMPGADENLQKDMTRFVQACDAVRDAFRCAVIGVHHAGKSGDMRGSTVLLGAGDFVFRLRRKKGATIGALICEKQKDAPDGWEEPYRFDKVALPEGESSLVVERAEVALGPSRQLTPETAKAVHAALQAAWDAGEPWSMAPQAGARRAVRRMVEDFGFTAEKAEEALSFWQQTGDIEVAVASSVTKKRGLRVAHKDGQNVQNEDVFD